MVRTSDKEPAGNKASQLSSANHSPKTIHRQFNSSSSTSFRLKTTFFSILYLTLLMKSSSADLISLQIEGLCRGNAAIWFPESHFSEYLVLSVSETLRSLALFKRMRFFEGKLVQNLSREWIHLIFSVMQNVWEKTTIASITDIC